MNVYDLFSHPDEDPLVMYYQWGVDLVRGFATVTPLQDLVLEQVMAGVGVLMTIHVAVPCQQM